MSIYIHKQVTSIQQPLGQVTILYRIHCILHYVRIIFYYANSEGIQGLKIFCEEKKKEIPCQIDGSSAGTKYMVSYGIIVCQIYIHTVGFCMARP